MTALPPISLRLNDLRSDDLPALIADRVLAQGRRLFNNGGVTATRAYGTQLQARVRAGGVSRSYQVSATVTDATIYSTCTCYQGSLCEHAAAVLLAWTSNRTQFLYTPPDTSIAPLPTPDREAVWRGARAAQRTVSALLSSQRVTDLRKLAQRVDLEAEGESKETLARRLGPLLTNSGRVAAALGEMNAAQRHVLQTIVLYGRNTSVAEIERVLHTVEQPASNVDAVLKSLVQLGLAFTNVPSTPAVGWQVPSEWLHAVPPGPLALASPSNEQVQSGRDLAFVTTLRALCMLIEAQPPEARPAPKRTPYEAQNAVLHSWFNDADEVERISKRSYGVFSNERVYMTMLPPPLPVSDAAFETLLTTLQQPSAAVALMLRLLQQLGLLEHKGNKLRLASRAALLWERSAVEQAHLLAATWAEGILWSEFHEVHGVRLRRHLQSTYSLRIEQVYAELAVLRRAVVRAVRTLDPQRTFSVEHLLERLWRIGPALIFNDPVGVNARAWQLCDRHGGVLDMTQSSDWRLAMVPFVQEVLRQMRLLGLVVVDDNLHTLRMTGLGAYLLGARAEYEAQASGRVLQAGDDLTLSVTAVDADATLLEALDRVAERQGFAEGRFRYRLTPSSVRAALVAGQDLAQITTFLEEHHAGELPASIGATIAEWAKTFGQLQIYGGVALLELADDLLLAELTRSTSLASALVYQLSPRILVIDPQRVETLWSELVAKGYTPQRVRLLGDT